MKNLLVYFSATGNTSRAIQHIADHLRSAGQTVELLSIFKAQEPPRSPLDWDRIVVAFPVLAFGAPSFVTRWLRQLPSGSREGKEPCQAAILACTGGGGGPAAANTARMLTKKGYRIVLSAQARFPENWTAVGATPVSQVLADAATADGDLAVSDFCRALENNPPRFDRPTLLLWLLGTAMSVLFSAFGRRFMGKLFHAAKRATPAGCVPKPAP